MQTEAEELESSIFGQPLEDFTPSSRKRLEGVLASIMDCPQQGFASGGLTALRIRPNLAVLQEARTHLLECSECEAMLREELAQLTTSRVPPSLR